MKKFIMAIVCLMTMVISANGHNTHYPTYTIDGITYVVYVDANGKKYWCDILKVDKPNSRTIIVPHKVTIDGEEMSVGFIKESAFATCTSLDSLIISDGFSLESSQGAFKGCRNLEYLYYSNCGYWNHQNRYYGLSCKTLETTEGCGEKQFWNTIGGSLEKLIIKGESHRVVATMNLCTNLKTIICNSTVPPTVDAAAGNTYSCEDAKFNSNQWSTITLYVPRESLEKYYFHKVWGEIDNIYAIDEMPIEESLEEINDTIINDDDDNLSANDSIFVYYDGEIFAMKDSNDSTICDREVKLTESAFIAICYALEAVGKKLYIEAENFAEENDVNNSVCETSSISSTSNKTHSDNFWHSFSGIMVDKPNKGVYIKNGKKYIIK